MKLNVSKTKVISFSRKTNVIIYDYKRCHSSIIRTYSIKVLGVFIAAKLHFHDHVNYIFSQRVKLLGIVRSITFNLSSSQCLFRLHTALVRSKMEYASVVWNSITSTDANKLGRIQQKFAALCSNRFFAQVHYGYFLALEALRLPTLHIRRQSCLSNLSLFWFKILSVRFGNCWFPSSCSVYQSLCIVQCLLFI
jgi:hypothetical protein